MINFQVPASWFEVNNIYPATVTLYRYHDDEWQSLATTMTRTGGRILYAFISDSGTLLGIMGLLIAVYSRRK